MNKFIYPAVFHCEDSGGYSIDFPDLLGCVSEGDTLTEAYHLAQDALGIYLFTLRMDGEDFPTASDPSEIRTGDKDFISLVGWHDIEYSDKIDNISDKIEYLKKRDNKSVKKTLSIPSWLNILAEEQKINFSQILQTALKEQLGIK